MKSTPFGAGQLKMKGKKVCGMKCGCCTAINFKDQVNEKFKDEEIKEYVVEINIERLRESLESGTVLIPPNLSTQEKINFICGKGKE